MDRSSYEGLDRPTTPPPSQVAQAINSGASSNINRAEARAGPWQEDPPAYCVADHIIDPDLRQDSPGRTNGNAVTNRRIRVLITDVFRSCPPLCTIHHLINFTLARVENVPVVPAVLDKGHQRNRTRPRF